MNQQKNNHQFNNCKGTVLPHCVLKKYISPKEGITLISLVVTIIILLILAGITLSLIGGSEGILGKTNQAVDENNIAMAKEQVELALSDYQAEFYEAKYVELSNNGTKKDYILGKLIGETYTQDYRVETLESGKVAVYEKNGKAQNLVVTGRVQEDASIKWDDELHPIGQITAKAEVITKEEGLEIVEIEVIASMEDGEIEDIQAPSGATLKEDAGNMKNRKIFTVTENGKYTFTILGSKGKSTTIEVTVNNVMTANSDLLTEIGKIVAGGVQEVEVTGRMNNGALEKKRYSLNVILHKGDLVLDGTTQVEGATLESNVYSFGNTTDVAQSASVLAENAVVLKVEGNLTITEGVSVTAISGSYGGPKGLYIYVTRNLTNNGLVTMSSRGAYANGENIYLWRNMSKQGTNNEYEYVPMYGSNGATSYSTSTATYQHVYPSVANAQGRGRGTAGGSSGGAGKIGVGIVGRGGTGGQGTSYSGGGGGGGTATRDRTMTPQNAWYYIGGQGVKTTEGNYQGTAYNGQTIGGGLLVIYGEQITVGTQGKFASAGKPINGSCWSYKTSTYGTYMSGGAGGGSGGGSINIFYKTNAEGLSSSNFEMTTDGYSPSGTYNVGSIGTEDYEKLLSN